MSPSEFYECYQDYFHKIFIITVLFLIPFLARRNKSSLLSSFAALIQRKEETKSVNMRDNVDEADNVCEEIDEYFINNKQSESTLMNRKDPIVKIQQCTNNEPDSNNLKPRDEVHSFNRDSLSRPKILRNRVIN